MPLEAIDYTRMSDLAYQAIRDAIVSGGIAQGARLNQDELAKRLGVSRAPVRDALNRLEAEGLVQTARAGGAVVAEATEQGMVDIYELRAILDAACTRLACERMSDEELSRLQEIVEATERVTDQGDLPGIVQAHAEFHYLVYAASGNAELNRVARNLWDRSYRFRVLALENRENARHGLAQHRAILTALKARDADRAVAAAEAHDQSSIRHLRGRVQAGEARQESPLAMETAR